MTATLFSPQSPAETPLRDLAPDRRNLTILAVDDDSADLLLIRRHLQAIQDWNVQLQAFQDWVTAAAALKNPEVDVLLLDVHLGGDNGLEILKSLRTGGELRPIIILTGLGDEHIAKEVMRAGADDYLNKRWLNSEILHKSVEGALDRCKLRREMLLLGAELRQAQRMEAVATLAGGLAHDFNNLLTGAMGFLEMALEKDPSPEVTQDLLKTKGICAQMAETVKHLLAFGRGVSLDFTEIHLQPFLEDLRSVLVHSLPPGIQLQWEVDPDLILIQGVPAQMHQVLMGMARNGVEAMEEGGTLTVRATHVLLDEAFTRLHPGLHPGEHAKVEVIDTGHGMDSKTLGRIFDPFFTTKTLDATKGRGASLALAWQAIRAHGGTILVESRPGRGACFTLYLPIKLQPAEAAPPQEERDGFPRGAETILLVDDEASLVEVGRSFLEGLGYRVFTAVDGVAALEAFEAQRKVIDLVVLDLSMPRMDGRSCFQRMRALEPDLRTIFMSGHDAHQLASALMDMGAVGVLQKPFRLRELAVGVRAALDGVRSNG